MTYIDTYIISIYLYQGMSSDVRLGQSEDGTFASGEINNNNRPKRNEWMLQRAQAALPMTGYLGQCFLATRQLPPAAGLADAEIGITMDSDGDGITGIGQPGTGQRSGITDTGPPPPGNVVSLSSSFYERTRTSRRGPRGMQNIFPKTDPVVATQLSRVAFSLACEWHH